MITKGTLLTNLEPEGVVGSGFLVAFFIGCLPDESTALDDDDPASTGGTFSLHSVEDLGDDLAPPDNGDFEVKKPSMGFCHSGVGWVHEVLRAP